MIVFKSISLKCFRFIKTKSTIFTRDERLKLQQTKECSIFQVHLYLAYLHCLHLRYGMHRVVLSLQSTSSASTLESIASLHLVSSEASSFFPILFMCNLFRLAFLVEVLKYIEHACT